MVISYQLSLREMTYLGENIYALTLDWKVDGIERGLELVQYPIQ